MSKDKDNSYIPFLYITYLVSPWNESNCLTDLGKELKIQNHLIYILKISSLDNY